MPANFQVHVLLTRVIEGNHMLSNSYPDTTDSDRDSLCTPPTPSDGIAAAVPATTNSKSLRDQLLSRRFTNGVERRKKGPSKLSSMRVQQSARYLKYLNEGSVTFKVKVILAVYGWLVEYGFVLPRKARNSCSSGGWSLKSSHH